MSSPKINNLMLIGGLLAYVSIIFLGVDTNVTSQDTFIWMCKVTSVKFYKTIRFNTKSWHIN